MTHTLHVDIREPQSAIDAVRQGTPTGWDIEVGLYEVGDYFVGNALGVERKSPGDFLSSIVDGRLFQQAVELRANFRHAIVLVPGSLDDLVNSRRGPGGSSALGAVASLQTRYEVPVFFSGNVPFGRVVFRLAEKAMKREPIEYSPIRKGASVSDLRTNLVAGLPGVGPTRARAIVERYGSVLEALVAFERWADDVSGIGPGTVEKAKEVLT